MLEDSSVRAAAGRSELGDGHAGAGFAASQVYGVFARRSVCRGCLRTHVMLPLSTLIRRGDAVEVIGVALLAKAMGAGHRISLFTIGKGQS